MSSAAEAAIHQCKNGHINVSNSKRAGAPATANTNTNGQLHSTCTTDKKNHAKSIKGNGHALQMAELPRRSRKVPILLETGHAEIGRLVTKHHLPSHHIAVQPTILTPTNDPKYTKLFEKKMQSTTKQASQKNSQNTYLTRQLSKQ
jgi:hypothetical protein